VLIGVFIADVTCVVDTLLANSKRIAYASPQQVFRGARPGLNVCVRGDLLKWAERRLIFARQSCFDLVIPRTLSDDFSGGDGDLLVALTKCDPLALCYGSTGRDGIVDFCQSLVDRIC